MKKKIVAFMLIFILIFNFITPDIKVFAAINERYGEQISETNYELGSSSLVLEWIAEILYGFASLVENVGGRIIKVFTGDNQFPWMDKVIFNTVPILDVNFINPASGSLFENINGEMTTIGNIVRNIYFTILSISLGFLGIVIGILTVKLIVSSIASQKAKYKQAIVNLLICVVLLFSVHYLLSFLFYLNETMVVLASDMLSDQLEETSKKIIDGFEATEDEDNKQLLENFLEKNDDECFIDSIPVVGDIWNGLTSLIQGIGNAIGKAWAWLTGNESDEDECDVETLKKIYPSREDYVDALTSSEQNINVAAYLLRNKFYRQTYFNWTSGTDTNSIANGGVGGFFRNIAVTANDIFGIVDTGYKSIRSLYTSTMLITFVPEGDKRPYETTQNETRDNLSDEERSKFDEAQNEGAEAERNKFNVDSSSYLTTIIKSTEDYLSYMDQADAKLQSAMANNNEDEVVVYTLAMLYAETYYKYVYEGDDKIEANPKDFLSEMGEYFKNTAYYVDLENGEWAPDTINVISAVLYAIFVIQSLIIFIAYIKRFFFVVILSMFGPIVVIADYVSKSI